MKKTLVVILILAVIMTIFPCVAYAKDGQEHIDVTQLSDNELLAYFLEMNKNSSHSIKSSIFSTKISKPPNKFILTVKDIKLQNSTIKKKTHSGLDKPYDKTKDL